MKIMVGTTAEYQAIELCHREQIDEIRRSCGHELSSHAFSSLYLWKNKMKLQLYLSEKLFCIKRGEKGPGHYFFPCGSEEEKLLFIRQLLRKGAVFFQYMREEDKQFLLEHFPGRFEFENAREDWEYIYDKAGQIKLEGSEFKNLRSKVHRGEHAHDWTILRLSGETLPLAAEIACRWKAEVRHKEEMADISATQRALKYYEDLNLSGILMLADREPLAFALGTVISEDTFDLHISKTLESDIDCYLKWELFRRLPENVRYINREEDLGIEGLRIHKTQMKPVRFHELWKGWAKAE
jgi:hypothetical protein